MGPDRVDPFLDGRYLAEAVLREPGGEVLGGRAHQFLARREVAVDGAMGKADSVGHILNREAAAPPIEEEFGGGLDDGLAGGFGVAGGGDKRHVTSMSCMS